MRTARAFVSPYDEDPAGQVPVSPQVLAFEKFNKAVCLLNEVLSFLHGTYPEGCSGYELALRRAQLDATEQAKGRLLLEVNRIRDNFRNVCIEDDVD